MSTSRWSLRFLIRHVVASISGGQLLVRCLPAVELRQLVRIDFVHSGQVRGIRINVQVPRGEHTPMQSLHLDRREWPAEFCGHWPLRFLPVNGSKSPGQTHFDLTIRATKTTGNSLDPRWFSLDACVASPIMLTRPSMQPKTCDTSGHAVGGTTTVRGVCRALATTLCAVSRLVQPSLVGHLLECALRGQQLSTMALTPSTT